MTKKWKFTAGMTKEEQQAQRIQAEKWVGKWNVECAKAEAESKALAGMAANREAAQKRHKYLKAEYLDYRNRIGLDPKQAREKANDEMADKFGEKYRLKDRQLRNLLKE